MFAFPAQTAGSGSINCAEHPEVPATAFCRECGRPMCMDCQRPALGSVYCAKHSPKTVRPRRSLPRRLVRAFWIAFVKPWMVPVGRSLNALAAWTKSIRTRNVAVKRNVRGVYISNGVEVNLRFDDTRPTSVEEQRDKVLRYLPRGLRELEIEGILHKGVREKGKSLGYFHRHPLMGGKPITCPSCGRALEPGKDDYELHLTHCPCGWYEACPGCGSLLFRADSHLTQCHACGWYDLTEAEEITRVNRFAINMGYEFWQRPENGATFVILCGVVLIPLAVIGIFLLGRLAGAPGLVSATIVLLVAYFLPGYSR